MPGSWEDITFLAVSVIVSLEEIWINRFKGKEDHPHRFEGTSFNPLRDWREQKGRGRVNLLSAWAGTFPALGQMCSWPSSFRFRPGLTYTIAPSPPPDSQAFGFKPNCTIGFPGSPTCRGQIIGFLSFHYPMGQFLW